MDAAALDWVPMDAVAMDPGSLDAAAMDAATLDSAAMDAATLEGSLDAAPMDAVAMDPGSLDAVATDPARGREVDRVPSMRLPWMRLPWTRLPWMRLPWTRPPWFRLPWVRSSAAERSTSSVGLLLPQTATATLIVEPFCLIRNSHGLSSICTGLCDLAGLVPLNKILWCFFNQQGVAFTLKTH